MKIRGRWERDSTFGGLQKTSLQTEEGGVPPETHPFLDQKRGNRGRKSGPGPCLTPESPTPDRPLVDVPVHLLNPSSGGPSRTRDGRPRVGSRSHTDVGLVLIVSFCTLNLVPDVDDSRNRISGFPGLTPLFLPFISVSFFFFFSSEKSFVTKFGSSRQ